MNLPEYLIQRLGEECAEVIVECSKANLYGLEDKLTVDPHGPRGTEGPTNRKKLIMEVNDVLGVMRVMVREGIVPPDWQSEERQLRKVQKVDHFAEYSRRVGTLIEME